MESTGWVVEAGGSRSVYQGLGVLAAKVRREPQTIDPYNGSWEHFKTNYLVTCNLMQSDCSGYKTESDVGQKRASIIDDS